MDVVAIYEQVEKIMGVRAPMPAITIGESNGYVLDRVTVRFDVCVEMNLAHEFSHHVAVHSGMLDGVRNQDVMATLEKIALDVEHEYPNYMPNCETKRRPRKWFVRY